MDDFGAMLSIADGSILLDIFSRVSSSVSLNCPVETILKFDEWKRKKKNEKSK